MARSFYRPLPQHAIQDRPYYHEPSATWYAMLQRGGQTYQRRWRIGPAGEEIDVDEASVDYTMGSGNHARTFLHRTTRGTLRELPLAWYSENGGMWALGPGLDHDSVQPPRTIAYDCMFCHNAYPRIPPGHEEQGSEAVYTGDLPEGIDCQRCHGPGSAHLLAAQSKNATLDSIRRAIVNPARLDTTRQMEVCMQCHLETTSRPLPHSIRRFDRGPFSYVPGEPLGDFMISFDRAAGSRQNDNFEIVNSAYRLRQSQCFLKSSGRLTCTTCHNPHDIPRGAAAASHYNTVCAGCHAERIKSLVASARHSSDANCVACHMPRRRTQDVIHAVMTDHLIQRRPPSGDLLAPLPERPDAGTEPYRGEVVPYYPSPLRATGEDALYAAVAQVSQKSNLARGLPRLTAEIAAQKPARPEFYLELGQAWLGAGKAADSVPPFQEAVRREPRSPVALLNLADALTQTQHAARAIEVLTGALRISPDDPLLWYQLGVAHSSLDHDSEAIAALEKSVQLDPDLVEARDLLGASLAGRGDLDRAETEWLSALRTYPDFAGALGNLAHLLALRGDLQGAAFRFQRAVKLNPGDAGLRTNYAVTLAGLNRFEEAGTQIDAAIHADPGFAEAHNFRGTLLDRRGRRDEALAEFREAIRLQPDYGRALLNAARILAATDPTAARDYLQRAARTGDPNIQRQAAEALSRLRF